MAGPENIKAGFMKENDVFVESGIVHASPFVSLRDRQLVSGKLYTSLKDILKLDPGETERAVQAGYQALENFTTRARQRSREILAWCAQNQKPCILVLARPYHMDSGIGHEIEADLQAHGYPILWLQYVPTDPDIMDWIFGDEIRDRHINSPFDIRDVCTSFYSANTNEPIRGAKLAWR